MVWTVDLDLIKMLTDDLGNSINNDLIIRERGVRSKNENYAETIIPLFSNNLFEEHFPMSPESFLSGTDLGLQKVPGRGPDILLTVVAEGYHQ